MASEVYPGTPYGLFAGFRAMTIQTYVEANSKNGSQFEASVPPISVPALGTISLIFITGGKPVIIKDRVIKFNGVLLTTRIYRAPVYTGGSPVTVFNLSDINPQPTTVQILAGATVSNVGTEFGAPTYDIGSTNIGNTQVSTYSVQGAERILRPNTVYLQQITNDDSGAAQLVSGSLTWYEGAPDLPLTGPLP